MVNGLSGENVNWSGNWYCGPDILGIENKGTGISGIDHLYSDC